MIGIKRVEESAARWKKAYDKGGILALDKAWDSQVTAMLIEN